LDIRAGKLGRPTSLTLESAEESSPKRQLAFFGRDANVEDSSAVKNPISDGFELGG